MFGDGGRGALRWCCWFVCLIIFCAVNQKKSERQKGEGPEQIGCLEVVFFFGGEVEI